MKLEIPTELQHLPRDRRGLPIPYVVFIDPGGVPHFKVNDEDKAKQCQEKRICHVCGRALRREFWFVGGQLSAFHPKGAFNDGPVHKVCALYALKTCPYMLSSSYKATDEEQMIRIAEKLKGSGMAGLYNPTQSMERLTFFVLARSKDFRINQHPKLHGITTISPRRPYEEVEYWLDGRRIHKAEAKELMKQKGEVSYLP